MAAVPGMIPFLFNFLSSKYDVLFLLLLPLQAAGWKLDTRDERTILGAPQVLHEPKKRRTSFFVNLSHRRR